MAPGAYPRKVLHSSNLRSKPKTQLLSISSIVDDKHASLPTKKDLLCMPKVSLCLTLIKNSKNVAIGLGIQML